MKKGVLKNFTNSTQKRLRWSLFLIKRQDFWLATLLKRDTNTGVFLREHSEIFKNAYFEVQTLENASYSCFFMSKFVHSVLGKVKKEYWNCFIVKEIWYSVKHSSNFFHLGNWVPQLPSLVDLAGKINWILVILQVYSNFFNICTKKKEVPKSISRPCSLSLLLYSERNIGLKWNKDIKIREIIPQKCKYVVLKFSKILNQI